MNSEKNHNKDFFIENGKKSFDKPSIENNSNQNKPVYSYFIDTVAIIHFQLFWKQTSFSFKTQNSYFQWLEKISSEKCLFSIIFDKFYFSRNPVYF